MSQFNKYARKFDEIARAAFKESEAAAARLDRATTARNQRLNEIEAAKAKAEYLEAQEAVRAVRRKLDEGEYRQQITALRKELAADVGAAFRADPAQIDSATLELLKSGICTPDEYGALLHKAAEDGNPTMCRLIGRYAEDAAAAATEKAGGWTGDPTATALRAVGYQSKQYNGQPWLEAFDYMADVYDRAAREPVLATLDRWERLTADAVEKF